MQGLYFLKSKVKIFNQNKGSKLSSQESLIRTQQTEKDDLASELLEEESNKMSSLLSDHYEERERVISDMTDKLHSKLNGTLSDAEVRVYLLVLTRSVKVVL